MIAPQVGGGLIARNTLLSFIGQLVPLVVGVFSIPYVVRGMGVDRFGVLSLAWMVLGYFTIFDLGLGRAAIKFVAEELRQGMTDRFRTLFWTTATMNLLAGIGGGLVIAMFTPLLAREVFQIPAGLVDLAEGTFFLLALSVPIVLVSTTFRGALEAAQRFEYVNGVAAMSSSLTYLIPVVGILLGFDVPEIVALLIAARLVSALVYFAFCLRLFPVLRKGFAVDFTRVRSLISYGGWISISNVVNPLLVYFDRFFIGSVISVAAVTYYTAPYEMITRVWILPTSLTMTLFPAFSAFGLASASSLTVLYSRSVKYLLLAIGPIVMLLLLFAEEILSLWLGSEFALQSVAVFRILAVGILFNSIAQVPSVLIQGLGRPDITAKCHLLEFVLYIPMVTILVSALGIAGGALAWTLRVVIDFVLLILASGRFTATPVYREKGLLRGMSMTGLMAVAFVALLVMETRTLPRLLISTAIVTGFLVTAWNYVLGAEERKHLSTRALSWISSLGAAR